MVTCLINLNNACAPPRWEHQAKGRHRQPAALGCAAHPRPGL